MQCTAAAAFQRSQMQTPHSDPFQPPDIQIKIGRHTPDLPVLPLGKYKFITAIPQRTDPARPQKIPLIYDPLFCQKGNFLLHQFSGKRNVITLFNLITGMGQTGNEFPVIGKKDQSFAILIQPSGRNHPHTGRHTADQFHSLLCRMVIAVRTHITAGFMQHYIIFPGNKFHNFPIHPDRICGRKPQCAPLLRDRTIHSHSPGSDPFCRRPPGTH